ncbi:MAG: alpha-ketoglutarate decarboxylase [Aestuariibaculum sp.]
MKKKILLVFLVTTLSFGMSHAQQNPHSFWANVRFGGGVGLSFGDGFFSGTLAPSAIYQINQYTAFGTGLNATFNNNKNYYKSTVLGGSLIGLFNPIREIQISTEFEELHVSKKYDNRLGLRNDSYWLPALYLGAGFRTGNVTMGIRFDVLHDKDKSIYAESWAPFVRFYF